MIEDHFLQVTLTVLVLAYLSSLANTAIEWIVTNLHANVILLNQLTVKSNRTQPTIILKLACSELFCLDSVAYGTWLMIFQGSCKHRIAASFAFKQKRSLQLSVQPTLRFQVPR